MNYNTLLLFVAGAVVPSFLVAWVSVWFLRPLALRWHLIDQPGTRKVHTVPTPLGGGVAIWLGVIVPFALGQVVLVLASTNTGATIVGRVIPNFAQVHLSGLRAQSPALWFLLAAGTLLMITGLLDDWRGLGWKMRLAIQFAIAGICVAWQGWRLTAFIDVPWITWLLSVVWIVALINSFNMLDNMDGLSSGVAAIAAAMLAALLLLSPDPQSHQPQLFVAGFLLVIVGALGGFLVHNRPPARIFMGDAGSYFIGFCIAVTTLLATFTEYQGTHPHAVLAPLCVLAVPLYDMVSVLWIRLREGRSPFRADKSHFSHRLVELGLTKGQAVLTIYLTTATCGLGALLLHQVDMVGAVIIGCMIISVLALIAILESTARRRMHSSNS